jgi:hypothetical protein
VSGSVVATVLFTSARCLSAGAPPLAQHSDRGLQRHEVIIGGLGGTAGVGQGNFSLDVVGSFVPCSAGRKRSVYLFMLRPPEVRQTATRVIHDL